MARWTTFFRHEDEKWYAISDKKPPKFVFQGNSEDEVNKKAQDTVNSYKHTQVMKKLERLAQELEDANYHRECTFISDLVKVVDDRKFKTADDILTWIAWRDWFKN